MLIPPFSAVVGLVAGTVFLQSPEGREQNDTASGKFPKAIANEASLATADGPLKEMQQLLTTVPTIDVVIDGFSYTELIQTMATLVSRAEHDSCLQSSVIVDLKSNLTSARRDAEGWREQVMHLESDLKVCSSEKGEMEADLNEVAVGKQRYDAIMARWNKDFP